MPYNNLAKERNIKQNIKENKRQVSKQNEKEYMNDHLPVGEHSMVHEEVECGDIVVVIESDQVRCLTFENLRTSVL